MASRRATFTADPNGACIRSCSTGGSYRILFPRKYLFKAFDNLDCSGPPTGMEMLTVGGCSAGHDTVKAYSCTEHAVLTSCAIIGLRVTIIDNSCLQSMTTHARCRNIKLQAQLTYRQQARATIHLLWGRRPHPESTRQYRSPAKP